jgi:hypothetical protein
LKSLPYPCVLRGAWGGGIAADRISLMQEAYDLGRYGDTNETPDRAEAEQAVRTPAELFTLARS